MHSIVLSNYHDYTRGSEQARPAAAPAGQAQIVFKRLGLLLPSWHAWDYVEALYNKPARKFISNERV